jgi:hypothetical protein
MTPSPHTQARNNAQKYVAYSAVTKIDVQANQKQAVSARLASPDDAWEPLRFDELADIVQEFVRAREWDRFHTPRDLTLALTGEVGELCELFQWKTEESCAVGLPGTECCTQYGRSLDTFTPQFTCVYDIAGLVWYLAQSGKKNLWRW